MDGEIPLGKINKCSCGRYFFKEHHRQKYCRVKCRNARHQTPYSKRLSYYRAIRKFEYLLSEKGMTREAAGEYLRTTQPYKDTIEDGNYNPEKDWLKKEKTNSE